MEKAKENKAHVAYILGCISDGSENMLSKALQYAYHLKKEMDVRAVFDFAVTYKGSFSTTFQRKLDNLEMKIELGGVEYGTYTA